jgi:hypothetical protein
VRYVEGLSTADLAGRIRYRTILQPAMIEQEITHALDHFFNHQTHHRGQAHCLLTAIAGDRPSLDLILFQRECGLGGLRVLKPGRIANRGGLNSRGDKRDRTAKADAMEFLAELLAPPPSAGLLFSARLS